MRLLLDTCTLLWCASEPGRLSDTAAAALANTGNELCISVVSGWEIHVKSGLGKLQLPLAPAEFLRQTMQALNLTPLSLDWSDLLAFERLRGEHRDPFDRLLACQALARNLQVVTPDPHFQPMGAVSLW